MIRHVSVVVPAADEEDGIDLCLRSIATARRHLRHRSPDLSISTVVVLDACRDATPNIVAEHRGVHALVSEARNVGKARQRGAAWSISRWPDPRSAWIASTDADSCVPPDWLTKMIESADAGHDLVLGTVLPDDGLPSATEEAWFDRHQLGDGHPHMHGANLGVRASALLALGGWEPLVTGEDVALARRAEASGLAISRTGAIPVVTSIRVRGRAPDGFSEYLQQLNRAG